MYSFTNNKKKAAIYVRVSSLKQKEEGQGIHVQTDMCKEYCEFKDYEIYKIYTDPGVSGIIEPSKRPAMGELIEDAKNKSFDIIVCYALDRLSRDTYNTLGFIKEMKECGIEIASCKESIDTNTYQGKFKIGLLAIIAELEINMIKNRLHMGRVIKKNIDGDIGGSLPYGYSRSKNGIIINPIQATIVKYIFFCRDNKKLSMNKIADILNKHNIKPSKKGKKWYSSSVKIVLDNREKYEGGLINKNKNGLYWPQIIN